MKKYLTSPLFWSAVLFVLTRIELSVETTNATVNGIANLPKKITLFDLLKKREESALKFLRFSVGFRGL